METFYKLFGSLLSFVYHCFDRMVILAYLPLLTREENIVHFFRDVNGIWPITQEALRERTNRYRGWVDSYAADHGIPSSGPKKVCARRITWLLPFSGCVRKEDPDYRILRRRRSRHFYFYIHALLSGLFCEV